MIINHPDDCRVTHVEFNQFIFFTTLSCNHVFYSTVLSEFTHLYVLKKHILKNIHETQFFFFQPIYATHISTLKSCPIDTDKITQ